MRTRSLLSMLALCFSSTVAAKLNWETSFDLSGKAFYLESATQQARTFGITPAANVDFKFNPQLSFFTRASALLETGSYKGTLLDEFKPDQQVLLNHAYFNLLPWHQFTLDAGAIPMHDKTSDLLVSATRFLGLAANQKINFYGDHSFSLEGLIAIPSNQELTNRLGNVSEGTPTYLQSGLGISLPGDLLNISAKSFLWGYSDVTGNVAFQSGFMGNQTIGIGATNTRLAYNFKGYGAIVDVAGEFTSLKWGLGADYLFNDGAPDSRNQAMRTRFKLAYHDHEFRLSWFEIEADAAIGYYNNAILGHTNREGFSFEYEHEYAQDISFGVNIIHAKTIRATLLQSDQDAVSFWWHFKKI